MEEKHGNDVMLVDEYHGLKVYKAVEPEKDNFMMEVSELERDISQLKDQPKDKGARPSAFVKNLELGGESDADSASKQHK